MKQKGRISRVEAILWLSVVAVCIVLGVYGVFIEPAQLIVVSYEFHLPKWPHQLDGLKIVVLSDIHAGALHIGLDKISRIVDETNRQNADLVLLLGDFVASGHGTCSVKPTLFASQLSRLHTKCGVYAVLGNHDWWYNGADVRSALESAHIRVLEDSAVMISTRESNFWLAGLQDLWTRNTQIERALAAVPLSSPVILMSHNPDVFPLVPERVTLTLAGHTHGGQVSLPLFGPPIVPSKYDARYTKGLILESGKYLFVSSGIGTSVLPIRIGVPPEISVLNLFGSSK